MEVVDEHFCEELNSANFKRITYVPKHQIGNANGRCSGNYSPAERFAQGPNARLCHLLVGIGHWCPWAVKLLDSEDAVADIESHYLLARVVKQANSRRG